MGDAKGTRRYAVYERSYCQSYASAIDEGIVVSDTDDRSLAFAYEDGYRCDSLDAFTLDRETGEVWDRCERQTYQLASTRYYVTQEYHYDEDAGAYIEASFASMSRAIDAALKLASTMPYCDPGEWWRVDVYASDEDPATFEEDFENGVGDGEVFHAEHNGIPRANR